MRSRERAGGDALDREAVVGDREPVAVEPVAAPCATESASGTAAPSATRPSARSACAAREPAAPGGEQQPDGDRAAAVVARLLDEQREARPGPCRDEQPACRRSSQIAKSEQRGRRRQRREQLAVGGEPLDPRADREQRDEQAGDEPASASRHERPAARLHWRGPPPRRSRAPDGPRVRPEEVERARGREGADPAADRPRRPGRDGSRWPRSGRQRRTRPRRRRAGRRGSAGGRGRRAARSRRRRARTRGVHAATRRAPARRLRRRPRRDDRPRGLYLTPDRYFLILLVPALALGVARRYVLDFLPFIALIILYEEPRGVAHIAAAAPLLRAAARHRPLADGEPYPRSGCRISCGTATSRGGRRRSRCSPKLHFIVPPTLLFLIWLRRRELYYRFAATIVAVCFAGALVFALWPAAPPWMAGRDGWIPQVHRIGYSQVDGRDRVDLRRGSTSSRLRNESAAVPSLHAAYALLVVLFCFALGRRVGHLRDPLRRRHVVHDRVLRRALRLGRADRLRVRGVGYVLVGRLWPRSPARRGRSHRRSRGARRPRP